MKIKQNTHEVEFLYKRKDFKRFGLKQNFKFNANLKVKKNEIEKATISADKHLYIKGYASTADQDRVDDIITIEALQKSEKDLMQPGSRTVFFNHNKNIPIGRVTNTSIDDKGLLCEIQISNADDCKDYRTKIKEKVLNSLSIGGRFKKVQVERDEDGNVTSFKVLELELFEVSIVGLPCNSKASIFNVLEKSFKDATNKKEKNMKTKEKEVKKEAEVIALPEGMSKAHADYISNLIKTNNDETLKTVIEPMQKSLSDIATLMKAMSEKMGEEKPKDKEVETKKDAEEIPSWAKTMNDSLKAIQDNMKDSNVRKGGVTIDEEEEEEEEVEADEVPPKNLKGLDSEGCAEYVKYACNDEEVFKALNDTEKKTAQAIYFKLMDKSNRQDR